MQTSGPATRTRNSRLCKDRSDDNPEGASGIFDSRLPGDQITKINTKNTGHWNPNQQALYCSFLISRRENFVKKELRRTDKIFKEMAKSIPTRGADQCRSHHQKMERKFPSIDTIIDSLKENCSAKLIEDDGSTVENDDSKLTALCVSVPACQQCLQVPAEEQVPKALSEVSLLSFDAINDLEQGIQTPGLLANQVFNVEHQPQF